MSSLERKFREKRGRVANEKGVERKKKDVGAGGKRFMTKGKKARLDRVLGGKRA